MVAARCVFFGNAAPRGRQRGTKLVTSGSNGKQRRNGAAASNGSTHPNPQDRRGKDNRPPSQPRTVGPIPDLERHLPAEWWRNLFNAIYLKTDGDVVEDARNTTREVDLLIQSTGITPNDRLLDLCCGQGRHGLELARRGFRHVTGVDRSRYLIRLARRRARQAGLPVTFHEGDARKFRLPPDSFHCVFIMGNSFGYFDTEEDDLMVLAQVSRALKAGGIFALDLADGDWVRKHYEPRSWEWIDQSHLVCRERSLSHDQARLICREVVIHAERGIIADQFYAERLYAPDRIKKLLESAGFTSVRLHDTLEAQSERNHDLGMMAQRIFLTSQAPRQTKPAAKRAVPFPEVTVLMGDPHLPDSVKMNGQFNEEDFETIRRLRSALDELPAYKFKFLDNHASLLTDLRADPPAFVLNLCDEGLNNNAFMELHVPAALEIFGIDYTGAGPSCLGLCYDKSLVRAVAASLDIPVPQETFFNRDDHAATIPSIFPALIKPNCGDSSIGITKDAVAHTAEDAVAYIQRMRELLPGRSLLIQEYLPGAEYSIAVIGNPGLGFTVLPPLEVDYSRLDSGLPQILSYESKWDPASPYWTQIKYREAQVDEDNQRRMVDWSLQLFERLGCRDYARFDYRADANGDIKLLEVNPNPGWCWDGKMNLMAEFADYRYADLLRMILETAQARVVNTREAAGMGDVSAGLVSPAGSGVVPAHASTSSA